MVRCVVICCFVGLLFVLASGKEISSSPKYFRFEETVAYKKRDAQVPYEILALPKHVRSIHKRSVYPHELNGLTFKIFGNKYKIDLNKNELLLHDEYKEIQINPTTKRSKVVRTKEDIPQCYYSGKVRSLGNREKEGKIIGEGVAAFSLCNNTVKGVFQGIDGQIVIERASTRLPRDTSVHSPSNKLIAYYSRNAPNQPVATCGRTPNDERYRRRFYEKSTRSSGFAMRAHEKTEEEHVHTHPDGEGKAKRNHVHADYFLELIVFNDKSRIDEEGAGVNDNSLDIMNVVNSYYSTWDTSEFDQAINLRILGQVNFPYENPPEIVYHQCNTIDTDLANLYSTSLPMSDNCCVNGVGSCPSGTTTCLDNPNSLTPDVTPGCFNYYLSSWQTCCGGRRLEYWVLSSLDDTSADYDYPVLLDSFTDYVQTDFMNEFQSLYSSPAEFVDTANLFTHVEFYGSTVGYAGVDVYCRANGANVNQMTLTDDRSATLVAHEMGHNMGLGHDSGSTFIMASGVGNPPQTAWSALSSQTVDTNLDGNPLCTLTGPSVPPIFPSACGNGIVDIGEECDVPIGTTDDPCCDSSTCLLQPGCVCATYEPCCNNAGNFRSSSFVCRAASSATCDIAETCSGTSGNCPVNLVNSDGASCTDTGGYPSYCYGGDCVLSRKQQCIDAYGGANDFACTSTACDWLFCKPISGPSGCTANRSPLVGTDCSGDGSSMCLSDQSCGTSPVYEWNIGEWSACLSGTATRTVVCIEIETPGTTVADSFCSATVTKPYTSTSCRAICGNDRCDTGEDSCSCSSDCGAPPSEICNNGVDDDCNGDVDCADAACAATCPDCPVTEICNNGIDDDCNGDVDCADSSCAATCPDCPVTEICNNGIDDDCDGNADCNDPDCVADISCAQCGNGSCDATESSCTCAADCGAPPSSEVNCTDAFDEDCDNLIDCADSDCDSDPACSIFCGDSICNGVEDMCTCEQDCGVPYSNETDCTDGLDEDCDGVIDCEDMDCAVLLICTCGDDTCDVGETSCNCPVDCGLPVANETTCDDGLDEDCDGEIDCEDDDCLEDSACFCGNGILDSGETCDAAGEHCSSACECEDGYEAGEGIDCVEEEDDEDFFTDYWYYIVGGGIVIILFIVVVFIGLGVIGTTVGIIIKKKRDPFSI